MKDIISEVIDNYISNKKMLKEYKNPEDSKTLMVCGNMLQDMYDRIIENGASKKEYTIEKLGRIIKEIRKLQTQFVMP
jgi:hypothetical protein